MKILDIFKRRKNALSIGFLGANATLYPDKILIETVDYVKEGFGISSTNITILPAHTDLETLGSTIRHHLGLTRTGLAIPADYKKHYQDFLRKAGFKNGKEHHKDALHLIILLQQNQITISPTRNGGFTGTDRGFSGIAGAEIIVDANVDNSTMGDKVKYGWAKCESHYK